MTITIHSMADETRALIEAMKEAYVGQTFTYDQLSKIAGVRVNGTFPGLQTVRKRLLKDYGIVLAAVRGIGLKRLSDTEILSTGKGVRSSLRRKSSRSLEDHSKVDFKNLDRKGQQSFVAHTSLMGAINMATRERQFERVQQDVRQGERRIPAEEIFQLFAGRGRA